MQGIIDKFEFPILNIINALIAPLNTLPINIKISPKPPAIFNILFEFSNSYSTIFPELIKLSP